jgi:hypothetical protein
MKTIALATALLLYAALPCAAGPVASADKNFIASQIDLIRQLHNEGRLFECVSETERLLFYGRGKIDPAPWRYLIAASYYSGRQYASAIGAMSGGNTVETAPFRERILMSQLYARLEQYDRAASTLAGLDYAALPGEQRCEVFFRRMDIFLGAGNYRGMLAEITRAETTLAGALPTADMTHSLAARIDEGWKSPAFAAGLSALAPGAGQIYTRRYPQGFLTLLAVAAPTLAAWHFAERDDRQLTITFGVVAALMYGGGIFGAYNAAMDANSRDADMFAGRFRQSFIPTYRPFLPGDAPWSGR